MEKDNLNFLKQLILSLEEAEKVLEKSYSEGNLEMFSKSKNFISRVQEKIMEAVDGL
jgi:hypothetical protein